MNDEARMTEDEGMIKHKCRNKSEVPWSIFVIRHLGFIRRFVIRHSSFAS
jgi:hypothetical protein